MTFQEARIYLNSFIDSEQSLDQLTNKAFKLERVFQVLNALDNPHKKLKAIHVAGSKGKGSTSTMIAHILKEAGYKVGLYTSPHIQSYNERIRILSHEAPTSANMLFSDCISDQQLAESLTSICPIIEKFRNDPTLGALTFYEVFTVLAFYFFDQEQVDFAVIETGLGGRLDATNVIDSMIAVITPISLEHTHILGDTLDKIAFEKAAIIKNFQDAVIAPQPPAAKIVIFEHCEQFKIKPVDVSQVVDFQEIKQDLNSQTIQLRTTEKVYQNLEIALLGQHQIWNAATAIIVAERIGKRGFAVNMDAIYRGLKTVFWPVRFEVIRKNPTIILDGAHNEDSMLHLVNTVSSLFGDQKVHLIFGVSNDKKIKEMCTAIKSVSRRVYITKADHKRAYHFSDDELSNIFFDVDIVKTNTVAEALRAAQDDCSPEDIILITGSIFLASEARSLLLSRTDYVSI
ncbi:MAG: bifunctional folylpolyglutamate synthase/dihydrofolate synthase [Candidatus Omnitrophica bacterium]|nr:bifunctional folylpolyglutamate synthase/dihydrofolate synthase [Candidatus Omnitrophota bacterium]